MTSTKYSFKNFDDHTAKACGKDLPISTKASINICSKIRGMTAKSAVEYLQSVVQKKSVVPFRRFTDGVGHRKGKIGPGRYPAKAATHIGKLIASAIANASVKGMDDTGSALIIEHINAHKGADQPRQGRQTRRSMKRTSVEVVLREDESKLKRKKSKSSSKASNATKRSEGKSSEKPSQKNVSKTISSKQSTSTSSSDKEEQSSKENAVENDKKTDTKKDTVESKKSNNTDSKTDTKEKKTTKTKDSTSDSSKKSNEVSQ
ncbi:MAG: 50S ribosomal protein L22 [Nanobdellota archaeon]